MEQQERIPKVDNPCLGCSERVVLCHSHCPRRASYKEYLRAVRAREKQYKEVFSYRVQTVIDHGTSPKKNVIKRRIKRY